MTNTLMRGLCGALLLATCVLGLLFLHLQGKAKQQAQQVAQLLDDSKQQSAAMAQQALLFQVFNRVAAASQQYAARVNRTSEEHTIEYRTILKKETVPVCGQLVPAAVSDRLLDYAHRLRAGAVSGAVADADRSRADPAATSALTYCQAVLWIDPLLSTIDKANDQLAGIREEDARRTASSASTTSQSQEPSP
ncbi:hypothetical protein [Nissabacter sp. SGAir0207]|uniref:hypothetical protein n=1 Tax=Nissabacter sp. SGAir0207 TaxID=2126321 RepID=UPI0010CCE3C0|nr:hypothetical protein [Nissabacter sp. SGAir0207]QCR38966.1 hypothetical protein C1N62_22905 [Nissabacter sp. SGAir0207]